MKCFYLLVLSLAVVGCESEYKEWTPVVGEWCYEGVVYLSKSGQTNASVKFNPDSTVATETFDGVKCK